MRMRININDFVGFILKNLVTYFPSTWYNDVDFNNKQRWIIDNVFNHQYYWSVDIHWGRFSF